MSGHRVVSTEECPQQPGWKQGDPVLTSLFALSPAGTPTHAPHGHVGAGAAAEPTGGCLPWPPAAISIGGQMARWPRCGGVEGKGGHPPLGTTLGESLVGSAGGGGEGKGQLATLHPWQGSVPVSLWVGPHTARAALWKQTPA